jgi:hypothetical protein
MEDEYINRVLIYLKQELPEYQEHLEMTNGRLIVAVPAELAFQPFYEKVMASVTTAITRIRTRKADIEFSVRSCHQQRDFKILK